MKVRGSARRFEHGRDSVERDQLADEERLERLPGLPVGAEDPLLGADKTDLDLVSREPSELGEKRRVRFGVGDDEVGPAKRASVDGLERAPRRRSRPESPAILDERVVKRDERVEDDRSAGSDATGRSEVEVAGVTDDQRIEICSRTPEELCLRKRQAGSRPCTCPPFVRVSVPDGDVALTHLDAGAAERRDHLRISRVVAFVRAEVEDAHFARPGLLCSPAP